MRRHLACAFVIVAAFVLLGPAVVDAAFIKILEPVSETEPVVIMTNLICLPPNCTASVESAQFNGILNGTNSTAFAVPNLSFQLTLTEPGDPTTGSDLVLVETNPVIAFDPANPGCPFGGLRPCQLVSITFSSFGEFGGPVTALHVEETGSEQDITSAFTTTGPTGQTVPVFPQGSLTISVLSPADEISAVPEPATLMLLGFGAVSVAASRRLRRS